MRSFEPELVIAAEQGERHYWRDLWRYRELFYFLAWRDVMVRYKQTAIGVAWVVLRPLLTMVILTVVFQHIAGLGKDSAIAYPLIVLAGLLPWQFFASAFADSGNSLVGNAHIISKVYFPRIIVPVSSVLAGVVDFLVTLMLLIPLMLWFGHVPDLTLLSLPLFMLLGLLVALGPGVLMAALNVRFRDVRYVIPFVVQFGLYLSPVGFRAEDVPEGWLWLYELNPMVGVIEGFRWALLGGDYPFPSRAIVASLLVAGVMMVLGLRYFRHVEKGFADVI